VAPAAPIEPVVNNVPLRVPIVAAVALNVPVEMLLSMIFNVVILTLTTLPPT